MNPHVLYLAIDDARRRGESEDEVAARFGAHLGDATVRERYRTPLTPEERIGLVRATIFMDPPRREPVTFPMRVRVWTW